MTKRRVPNVVRGGIAIPIKDKTNYYYMLGRKHTNGGIDIGENPKTGIEVEDGEIMHITNNGVRVFSAVPFLDGESPAQKVIKGENANEVFNEQERFKKVNNIKDDGSNKKKTGGTIYEVNVSKPNKLSRDAIKGLTENPSMDLYIDNVGNVHYGYMFEPDKDYVEKHGLKYIPIDDRNSFFESYLKSLDYIGGTTKQARDSFFKKMPNVSQFVDSIARKYNITPELLRHRLSKEGFVDKAIKEYNGSSNKVRQQNFNNAILNDTIYNGFESFGLDNGYEYLTKRKTSLKDDVEWYDVEAENEKGKKVRAATGKTVRDNIILQAAVLEHLKDIMKARGVSKEKLETWTNAAYNLGPYHKDLNDSTYIEKHYNFNNKKLMGGNNKKLNSNNGLFYSVTDRGKTKHYMMPSKKNKNETTRTKAKFGLKYDSPILSSSINALGAIGSYFINEDALKHMQEPTAPIPRIARKLKTSYNIAPELSELNELEGKLRRDILNNTASSNVALSRINNVMYNKMIERNKLNAKKENEETRLINADRLNQQEIANKNIEDYNEYINKVKDFRNNLTDLKSENTVSLVSGMANSLISGINTYQQHKQFKNNLWLETIKSPNASKIIKEHPNFFSLSDKEQQDILRNMAINDNASVLIGNDGKSRTKDEISKLPIDERKRLYGF